MPHIQTRHSVSGLMLTCVPHGLPENPGNCTRQTVCTQGQVQACGMSAQSEAKEGRQCRGPKTIATKAAVLSDIQHPLLRKAQQPSLQKCNIDQLMQNARQINSHAVGYLVHGACKRSPVQCRNEYNKFTCSRSLLCPAGLPIVQHFAVAQVKTSTTNLVSVLVGQPTFRTKRHSATHLICMQNGCQPLCESESGKIFMQTMSHPLCVMTRNLCAETNTVNSHAVHQGIL